MLGWGWVGNECRILVHSWIFLSGLECPSLQSPEWGGEHPLGSLGLRLPLLLLGKKPVLSRVRFDYSSLAVQSLLA